MQKQANEKIGQYAQRIMLSTQLGNTEILKLVKEQFPEGKTSIACMAWYRSDLKKNPKVVQPTETTLESIDFEILEAETKLDELRTKREKFIEENATKIEERKAQLRAELEALENV